MADSVTFHRQHVDKLNEPKVTVLAPARATARLSDEQLLEELRRRTRWQGPAVSVEPFSILADTPQRPDTSGVTFVPDSVATWSSLLDGTNFVSQRWLSHFDLDAASAEGDGWTVVIHPDDRDVLLESWETARGTGAPYDARARFRVKSEYHPCLIHADPVHDDRGRIIRWSGTTIDTSALIAEIAAESSTGCMLVEASALTEPAPSRPERFRSHRLDEIRLRRVLDYIAENLDQEITVAKLASVACLSPFHFARMFRAATRVAPYRYVSQQRLERAKMMLADGKQSLSDIAFNCQFSSQTSFNRAFLRATGVTPGEYRRARVEERYLLLQQARSKVQQHRHPCAKDGSSEEALQNLPQYATPVPDCPNCVALRAASVVEASPTILSWRCRPDGEMETHSRGWIAYFGLDLKASLKGWENLIHYDDTSAHFERWRKALATGEPYVSEARYRCADGQYRPVLVRAQPRRDRRGQIVKWYGVNAPLSDTVDDVLAQFVPVDDGLGANTETAG
jgi:PAS domain S-box-containing protein